MKSIKTSLREEIYEIFWVIKACLTSFWFWLPILFAILMFGQLLLICIHPLLLLVAPTLLSIYSILQEDERLKECYGLDDRRGCFASDPLGSPPRILNSKLKIENENVQFWEDEY
jgi:hypothetical protein